MKITISVLQKVIMTSGCVHTDVSPLSGLSMFILQPIHTIGFDLWKFIPEELVSSTSRVSSASAFTSNSASLNSFYTLSALRKLPFIPGPSPILSLTTCGLNCCL